MATVYLEEIDSTNRYSKSNLDGLEDRTVVHALRQNSGRGRLQRSWVDLGEGNLFLSFVLKPSKVYDEKFANLTQYLSVVLCQLLESYGILPQIKWPNDVLINGRKIAGILSETVMQGNSFKGLVLGIGVNLNAVPESLNMVKDKPVTALNLEISKSVDLNDFRDKLVSMFFENYDKFLESGFSYIKDYYICHANFLDKEVCVQVFNDKKSGVAKKLTDNGELILEKDGSQLVLTIGDIL